jgi:hypothetical protein
MVKTSKNQNNKKRKWLVVLATILVLYFVSLFVPLISPFSKFPLYTVKCGGVPIEATNFSAASSYSLPGDRTYRITSFTSHYFCSEEEAHDAGFYRSPLAQPSDRP